MTDAADGITLRPITEADLEFLCRVYASTREEELSAATWAPGEKESFLLMQFDAQHRYYQANYDGAEYFVIEENGAPIGRLYVARWPEEIRLMDIALLPEYRGRGLGTAIMKGLFDEARSAGKPLRIHVEKWNPAMRLYERLGFRLLEDRGVYDFLEWTPVK